jgi:hypothetical protein
VLFFIHLESRKVDIAGITVHPNERWMQQMARNVTMEGWGTLQDCRYLLHDRDTKYTISFRAIIESGGVKPLALPARSPNLNAYAKRWVRSVKDECLSKIILFGERSLRRALSEYVEHYHAERNHQGKGNVLLFPLDAEIRHAQPCNAARGWAGSCAITIKKPRDFSTGRRDQMGLAMRPIKSGPLSNREIKELDAFLLADDSLENAMDVSTLDGFLCAVVSGPKIVSRRNGCGGSGTWTKGSSLRSLPAKTRRNAS